MILYLWQNQGHYWRIIDYGGWKVLQHKSGKWKSVRVLTENEWEINYKDPAERWRKENGV